MKPKAFSYLRFSTPEQQKGDSFRRQLALAEAYAARHGLDLDHELAFHDLGVSGYRGRNANVGALRAFRDAVLDGAIPAGSFLLVESLDRVSRQAPWRALPVFTEIVNSGVTLVTLQDGKTFSEAVLTENPWLLIESLLTMVRAHEESATKARRLAEAWKAKRVRAADKPLTARTVAWVELDRAAGALRLIPERAAVVQRIFAMALEGRGQHHIAQALNRDGVPTFGDPGTSRKAAMWHRSYVAKMLGNPAAMGVLVPHVMDHEGEAKRRKPLDPVPGYYPQAVDAKTFQAVQAMRGEGGRVAPVVRGGEAAGLRSVLAGLARCPECGGSMTRVMKGAAQKAGKPKLVCAKAKAGAGCPYVSVSQDRVEAALLASLEELAGNVPAGDDRVDAALARAEAGLATIREEVGHVLTAIRRGNQSPTLAATLRDLEGEQERAEREVKALSRKAATVSAEAASARVQQASIGARDTPADLGRINACLRAAFAGVVVDHRDGRLKVQWKHGGESSVMFAWV